MKKGKRTVVVKNAFDEENQGEQVENSIYQSGVSEVNRPNRVIQNSQPQYKQEVKIQQRQRQTVKVEEKAQEVVRSADPEQEKKSRIEQLKQKYLKKSVESTTTPVSNAVENQVRIQEPVQATKRQKVVAKEEQYVETRKVQPKAVIKAPAYDVQKEQEPDFIQPTEEIVQQPVVEERVYPKKVNKVPPPPVKKGPRPPPPLPPQKVIQEPQQQQVQQEQEEPEAQRIQQMEAQPQIYQPEPPKKRVPPTNSVQDILAKRLQKKAPPPMKKYPQPESLEDKQDEHQDFSAENYSRPQAVAPSMPIDEQYLDRKVQKQEENLPQKSDQNLQQVPESFDLESGITYWCQNPDNFFSNFINPESALIVSLYQPVSAPQLNLKSKNTSFSAMINKMVIQFVFGSNSQMTQGQRNVVNELALDYFFGSGSQLSVQFLLLMVKLGSSHLKKYSSFFIQNSKKYCTSILKHKQCFIPSQLCEFVDFILDSNTLTQQDLFILLLLQPTEHLSTFLSSYNFNSPNNLVFCLASCSHALKANKNVLGIYLRLIGTLIDAAPIQTSLLEKMLNHLNHIQSNQKYYQVHKQVKLKLINAISMSQQNPGRIENRQDSKGDGKGIMGIWSKASDFIKTTANQLVKEEKPKTIGNKNTVKEAPEEPPEDDIVWDPVLRRYRINGEIPQDDSAPTNHSDPTNPSPPKKPVPPPAPKPKGVAPPPPPGRKPRTVTATNRYA